MYKKIKAADMPKVTRKRPARFESTPEWVHMKADLEKGIKPGEVLQLTLTAADRAKHKIRGERTVPNFLLAYIKANKLPYVVRTVHRDEHSVIHVQRKK